MQTDIIKGFYKLNSDNKLELHLESKQTYSNLPEEVKRDIKSGFLWGSQRGAWVSRSKGGHIPYSMKNYVIPYEGKEELKSFEEAESQKAARLDAKADRFLTYSENAKKRAETLQSDFNRLRKDWSWLTQPNINTSGGRSFANSRNKVMARYERGFSEWNKAESMAEYSKQLEISALQTELEDIGYLNNRIKENRKILKGFPKFEEYYNEKIKTDSLTDEILIWLDGQMNRYKLAFDKLEYYQHFYDKLIEEKKEEGTFFDEAEAKKTVKKDFKIFLKKHFDINLLQMSIAYTCKRETVFYYKTNKPLPKQFLCNWASDCSAQMGTQKIYQLMQKHESTLQEEPQEKTLFHS